MKYLFSVKTRCVILLLLVAGCQSWPALKAVDSAPELTANRLKPLKQVDPRFPSKINRCQSGWVHLRFTLDRQGNVYKPQVVNASPTGLFEQSALTAIRQWRYAAAEFTRSRVHNVLITFPPKRICE